MPPFNFTFDTILIVLVGLLIVYGLLLGHDKIRTLALSVYVGIVLATQLGQVLQDMLSASTLEPARNLSGEAIKLILLILPVILLEFGRHQKRDRRGRYHIVPSLILAVLTALLAVSSALDLLEEGHRSGIVEQSALATLVYRFRLWWVGLVPLGVIIESFLRPKESH